MDPLNGPAVWTVIVTVAGDAAFALIWVGLNEYVTPAGRPDSAYVTLLVNALPPTVEMDMVVDVDCPGLAAVGAVRVAGTVKA